MTKELYYSSINELNELYINKKTSPTEVTKVFLERIKKHDSDLNSFINVYENDAIEDAKEAEKYISNKNGCYSRLDLLEIHRYTIKKQCN